MWKVQPDIVDPQAAIDWFKQRLPITPDQFYALEDRSRRQAFTVSGLGGLDVIQDVLNRLQVSLENGTTFEEFKRDLPDQMRKAWGAGSAFRLGTIFDTNIQSAYQAGRWHAADEVRDSRPYWSLETVLDSRTSRICQMLRGTTLPADDPFWKSRGIPPFHFRCRTTLITFTREQAQARGISSKAPDVVVPDGFGHPPNAREWQPDPSKYDPALWAAYQKNQPDPPSAAATSRPRDGAAIRTKLEEIHATRSTRRDELLRETDSATDEYRAFVRTEAALRLERRRAGETFAPDATTASELERRQRETQAALEAHTNQTRDALHASMYASDTSRLRLDAGRTRSPHRQDWQAGLDFVGRLLETTPADLPAVKIVTTKRNRSYYQPDEKKIYLGPNAKARTMVHETGHWLEEFHPNWHAKALEFFKRRTGDEQASWLGRPYGRNETGKRDDFKDVYIGKLYERNGEQHATEIISMGLEFLHQDPIKFAQDDSDYFDFIWSILNS